MLNLHYLYAKIGPICAVGQCFENKIHCVDVWHSAVDENVLRKKYKKITPQPWLKYDKNVGFVSDYDYKPLYKTELQENILTSISRIPVGQTRSYQDIAKAIGNRYWARAVGQACASNMFPLLIPCHRVVGVSNPWAYSGGTLEGQGGLIKKALIEFEQGFCG